MATPWGRGLSHYIFVFWVTVTLTSDLNSRKIVSGANRLYYLRQESHIWYVDTPWDPEVSDTVFGVTVTLTSGLSSRTILSLGAFVLFVFI